MIDAPEIILSWMLNQAPITAQTTFRIWAERFNPPVGYSPSHGGAIAFRVRGGSPDYSRSMLNPSVQFKCYGPTATAANAVYRGLYDAFRESEGGGLIRAANLDVLGTTLQEPDTGWIYVLCFGSFWLKAS